MIDNKIATTIDVIVATNVTNTLVHQTNTVVKPTKCITQFESQAQLYAYMPAHEHTPYLTLFVGPLPAFRGDLSAVRSEHLKVCESGIKILGGTHTM
jgi:hypothetical protein